MPLFPSSSSCQAFTEFATASKGATTQMFEETQLVVNVTEHMVGGCVVSFLFVPLCFGPFFNVER
jgi:uncharacterized membrane protein YjjB (DUF3815 family)